MKSLKKFILASTLFFSVSLYACTMSDIQFAMSSIHHYIEVRPYAADTVEGVHHFWIDWPAQTLPHINCTFVALTELESEGFLERFQVANKELWRRRR